MSILRASIVVVKLAVMISFTACAGSADRGEYTELETINEAEIGYSIQVPRGHKVLRKSKLLGHTYSYILPSNLIEYHIHLTPFAVDNLDDLIRTARRLEARRSLKRRSWEVKAIL